MDSHALEQHWNETRTRLVPLRRLLSGESEAEEKFDEFISQNELGLALHNICDFLLERDLVMIDGRDVETIKVLQERMQMREGCITALGQHRERKQQGSVIRARL